MPFVYDLETSVPPGSVPVPQWVTRDAFEAQLARVHRFVPDPRVGLYGPQSMMWRIGRCHLANMLGSGRALLLQIAHPWVTQGVDHHSHTRSDPIGRLRRTFTNLLSISFGSLDQAFAAAERVHNVHKHIRGTLEYSAGGFARDQAYGANELHALAWVNATLWDSAMRTYELVVEPVSAADKDRYYEEIKLFALLFGIPPEALPPDWNGFIEYNMRMWESDQLAVTPATRDLARHLFKPALPGLGRTMRWMERVTAAILPPRLRDAYELSYPPSASERFEVTVKRLRRTHRWLPGRIRYSPTYYEAMARIEGRRGDVLTRVLNRATLGRWELVSSK